MTIAEIILARSRGANEARAQAQNEGATATNFNGIEVLTFWQDNSALVIFGGVAVIVGKGF